MSDTTLSIEEALRLITSEDLAKMKKFSIFISNMKKKYDDGDYLVLQYIKRCIDMIDKNAISRNDSKVMEAVKLFRMEIYTK